MANVEIDVYNSVKWTSIATCVVLILYSFVLVLENLGELNEKGEHHPTFFESHGLIVVECLAQLVICSFGIFAVNSEEYSKVQWFAVSVTILFTYKVIAICFDARIDRVVAIIALIILLVLSWYFSCLIYRNMRANVQPVDSKVVVKVHK